MQEDGGSCSSSFEHPAGTPSHLVCLMGRIARHYPADMQWPMSLVKRKAGSAPASSSEGTDQVAFCVEAWKRFNGYPDLHLGSTHPPIQAPPSLGSDLFGLFLLQHEELKPISKGSRISMPCRHTEGFSLKEIKARKSHERQ